MVRLTRRQLAILPAAFAAAGARSIVPALAQAALPPPTRPIPSTGEPLPAVGLGTAAIFDTADAGTLQNALELVRSQIDNGGQIIDTTSTNYDDDSILG